MNLNEAIAAVKRMKEFYSGLAQIDEVLAIAATGARTVDQYQKEITVLGETKKDLEADVAVLRGEHNLLAADKAKLSEELVQKRKEAMDALEVQLKSMLSAAEDRVVEIKRREDGAFKILQDVERDVNGKINELRSRADAEEKRLRDAQTQLAALKEKI